MTRAAARQHENALAAQDDVTALAPAQPDRRAAKAERNRRYRKRVKAGHLLLKFVVVPAELEALAEIGLLAGDDDCDRAKVVAAIKAAIKLFRDASRRAVGEFVTVAK